MKNRLILITILLTIISFTIYLYFNNEQVRKTSGNIKDKDVIILQDKTSLKGNVKNDDLGIPIAKNKIVKGKIFENEKTIKINYDSKVIEKIKDLASKFQNTWNNLKYDSNFIAVYKEYVSSNKILYDKKEFLIANSYIIYNKNDLTKDELDMIKNKEFEAIYNKDQKGFGIYRKKAVIMSEKNNKIEDVLKESSYKYQYLEKIYIVYIDKFKNALKLKEKLDEKSIPYENFRPYVNYTFYN